MDSQTVDLFSTSDSEDLIGAVGGISEQDMSAITVGEVTETAQREDPSLMSQDTAAGQAESAEPRAEGAVSGENVSGVDKLFLKQKNEIMYELRKLQLGDKPVSGKDSRTRLERFFTRNSSEGTSTDGQASTSEEHRPEAVIVEVQGLVQQRRVSSILSSAAFRRRLENAVRGHLSGTLSRSPSTTQARRTTPSPSPLPPSPLLMSSSGENVPDNNALSASSGSLNSILTASSTSLRSDENRRSQTPDVSTERAELPPVVRTATPPPPPSVQIPSHRGIPRAQEWLQQQQLQNQREHIWENLEDHHRDDLVMEITELVQQQLVTSSLNGETRGRLERHLQRRVHSSDHGDDGERVQSFVRSLQPTQPHVRNDFSHLGIETGGANDNLDEISVISATAAVQVPYSQSQAAMKAEMQGLKSQMKELQTMMKLSFDLQMDIQRSIRQEVAAALSQVMGGATVPQPERYSRPVNDSHCIICLDKHADSVLYQCGHLCVCNGCGLQLQSRGSNCPVCRAPIRDVIRAYKSASD